VKKIVVIGLSISLVIAGFVSYFASENPDGLERVAADKGFIAKEKEPPFKVMPDYSAPFVKGESKLHSFLRTSLAGVIGVIIVFACCVAIARLLTGAKSKPEDTRNRESR